MDTPDVSELTHSQILTLLNYFQPSEEQAKKALYLSDATLKTINAEYAGGMLFPDNQFNPTDYTSVFDRVDDRPSMATKPSKTSKKRGRKTTAVHRAFENIPNEPVPAEQFAKDNDISLNVLRQTKRFDPFQKELGNVIVKQQKVDDNQKMLMVWREPIPSNDTEQQTQSPIANESNENVA